MEVCTFSKFFRLKCLCTIICLMLVVHFNQEEVSKKRTRRAVKFQRAITGASLAEILAKRNQKPEVRKAQREQTSAKTAQKPKIAKPMKISAPRVGGKR
uniref:Uncharacterized protein n=1 Tax=Xiphophorus couchianus TaxID=32473 RepID=A0A3B5MLK1_9TELE